LKLHQTSKLLGVKEENQQREKEIFRIEKIIANVLYDEWLIPKISRNFNLIAKRAKVLNIHFPREDTHIANTYFKDAQCHPS
jgi:hypothetical protein